MIIEGPTRNLNFLIEAVRWQMEKAKTADLSAKTIAYLSTVISNSEVLSSFIERESGDPVIG
jgi:hypothetical protein